MRELFHALGTGQVRTVARAVDVAAYILSEPGPMTAMKLQKLVYYSQAWHLVWEEQPLFDEQIEAWANGPVVPDLYRLHRGRFQLDGPREFPSGDAGALEPYERDTVDLVLDAYAARSAHWLSELTHSELPWKDARRGLAENDRGRAVIEPDAMFEFYDGLTSQDAEEL